MENAYGQPSSKIIGIGGNRFLMTFLDDTASRDAMQAATLKWTVYDANNDSWTAPQTVQNDSTADGRPHLADAGDKVILTWSSIAEEKYEALKADVAAELGMATNTDLTPLVQDVLEKDPARVMACMDIFTAEFDKATQTFGPIEQLTDDAYYDDMPLAVYDAKTGDYIIIYNKSAQDDEKYDNNADKLMDLVSAGPNPGKTYSVVCYMLYNNQTGAEDTNGQTHAPGWARDYLFPLETDQTLEQQAAFLAAWGGQRFLDSALHTEDGGQVDPPINDLTAAPGYISPSRSRWWWPSSSPCRR